MDINKHIKNNILKVKVIPNSSRTELIEDKIEGGFRLKLYLKVIPEKGKANAAIVKFFKKEFNLKVEIKSGKTNREKLLRIFS